MTWHSKFEVTVGVSELIERERLDVHLDAVAAGKVVGAPQLPSSELGRLHWQIGLDHGELLAGLGLRERAAGLMVVQLVKGTAGVLVDEAGRPLAMFDRVEHFDDAELLQVLAGRELVLLGAADQLWALAEILQNHGITPRCAAVIVDHAPLLPGAAKLLHESFAAVVGVVLRDELGGGYLALACRFGDPLVQLRRAQELCVTSPNGDRLAAGLWGLLGVVRDDRPSVIPIVGRLQPTREGEPAVELGVPATPLDSSSRPELNTVDLHDMLGTLPVFAYYVHFERGGNRLSISLVPGVDPASAQARVLEAIAPGIEAMEVSFAEPGTEFPRERVYDGRGIYRGRVTVVWAGEPDSDSRRAAWRAALNAAGAGRSWLRPVDAVNGVALTGTPAEVAAGLRDDRADMPSLFTGADIEVAIGVGDPRREPSVDKIQGWVSLLDGDAEHEPMFIAGGERTEVAMVQALFESGTVVEGLERLSLDGVGLHPYTRPMLSRGRDASSDRRPLWLDASRCVGSGDCQRICPTGAIEIGVDKRPVIDADACIRCHLCVERCDVAALRPLSADDHAISGPELVREAAMLHAVRKHRARALTGKLVEPPPALDRRVAPAAIRRKPTVVLGLATVTLMEHTAALLVDGKLVSAIEEERLVRERHYTYKHPTRPGTSLSSDVCLTLEDAWPPRAIEAVLRTAGLTMDDVDVVAVNGIPARFRQSFSGGGGWRPPPVLRANSVVFVPHHMAHAASVYGLSSYDDAWILSIDGRGDYETATVWRAEGHQLAVIDAVPWLPDCSFGGVYETATRVLGFGTHGQGSTMALAALGEPTIDVSSCMSLADDGKPILSEWAAEKVMAPYTRGRDEALTDEHRNLAASIQRALETTVGDYLAHHVGDNLRDANLALCGGVALNCRMNGILRDRFSPKDMSVPPGANDAGTAIGAAIIGHRELTGELPRLGLGHSHMGPEWSDEAIERALERMRVPFQRMRDVADQTAELLAAGRIVCWFQGPMEFGPRALGGRSILADPRRDDLKPRLNAMKSREPWRPFGPSILAGRQGDWFVQDWDSRFMLFAVDVKPELREKVPVIVHDDGTSRPQVVHAEQHPRYHAMISAFEKRTGVPMVVNTSFNRGGEPIVCNPAEALRSFAGLGADAIVLGGCLVRRDLLRRR